MNDSQSSLNINMILRESNTQPYKSVSTQPTIKYKPMIDPLSVYVPLNSLTEETIDSIISTVFEPDRREWSFSKRTLIAFLLAIYNEVSRIEQNESNIKLDRKSIECATQVRQLLVQKDHSGNVKKLDWNELRERYDQMAKKTDDGTAAYFGVKHVEPYYELTIEGLHPDISRSREYMARFRSHGWESKELKVYWNVQQLENLRSNCEIMAKQVTETNKTEIVVHSKKQLEEKTENPKTEQKNNEEFRDETKIKMKRETKYQMNDDETSEEVKTTSLPSWHDPSDADAVETLRQYPVSKRQNSGKITYVHKGIEEAVFDIPETAQIIVLNFANERSPGGGYLRHCWAQEEIILYNSDGYRALLDLKYGRMGGGYVIPEFGLAYVRDIRFFDRETDRDRKTDMLVSACYCLTGSPQLFSNPKSDEEWKIKNLAKFQAFIAAAVANTRDDGSNTYLLLGPIGTGAFGNDVKAVANIFREVLMSSLMGSTGPIYKAFENIWFVSTDKWKNDDFKKILCISQ